jgi:Saxitoxin biosynthesis operon protein SxtJ
MQDQGSNRELRRFAFTVGTGLALIGALSRYRGHTDAPMVLWVIAAILWLLGLVQPSLLLPVQRAWMAFASILGWVNTRIILGLLFYVVLTPVSVLMRFFRDPLDRRLHDGRNSYWIQKKAHALDSKEYERQF